MLPNKLLVIGMLLMSVGSIAAWDDEGGLTEDELFDIMFNSAYMYTDIENPNWYDPVLTTVNNWMATYEGYFTHTPPQMRVRVQIKKMIWTGALYVEDTDFVDLDSSTYFQFKANTSETIQVPVFKPMQEVFKDNPDEFENFKTVDEDLEHPDIFNVSTSITADGESLDFENYGYITFTDDALGEIESQMNNPDYGFSLDGRGSGGGSGSIYEGIDMYGSSGGDTTGMGKGFNTIFWCIIPLVFILAVMKLSSRVLK